MNKITAKLEFSFKGEHIQLSAELNLDDMMKKHHTIPPLHQYLAALHKIDSYSYEYEMLLAEDVQFSHAEGGVAEFVNHHHFDQVGFEQYWHQQQLLTQLAPSIKQQLNIDDINQHPELKSVLMSAYQLGKDTKV